MIQAGTISLADQLELERVVWTMGRCLDERDLEGLRHLFTADATVITGETANGHNALVEQARRRHSDDASVQHILTNLIVEPDGEEATGRANLLVSFAKTGPDEPAPVLLGEVYWFTFKRTPKGWRISALHSSRTWSITPQPR